MRQPARLDSTACTSVSPCAWPTAWAKSQRKTDRPSAASGTWRAVTSPLRMRAHSTEPAPTPTEKKASISVTTCASAPMSSRTRVGSSASRVAPTTQNQLSPSRQSQTGRLARAVRSRPPVSRARFQPIRRSGASEGARGIIRRAAMPPARSAARRPRRSPGRRGSTNSAPPAMVPTRMPRKVPASTRPLPATSSSSARWLGRIAYFSGLKNVACTPRPNSTPNSSGMLPVRTPPRPAPSAPARRL